MAKAAGFTRRGAMRDRPRRSRIAACPAARAGRCADQDRHALRADRPGRRSRRADAPRRRVLGQAAERQGRTARPADRAPRRGHRRRSRHLRAQGTAGGGARRLPPAVRHDAVVRGARGGAEARRVERDLRVVRQRRRAAHRIVLRAQLLPREHLGADGDARDRALAAPVGDEELLCDRHGLCLGPQQHRRVPGRGEEGEEELRRRGVLADRHQGLLHLHHQDPPVGRRRLLHRDAGRRQQRVPVTVARIPTAFARCSCSPRSSI